ncbi:cellulose biosynthesis protein BcsP [Bordetella trematum]|uniref:cellulose biosynthesis protein BcsP n=1 Tax=Bordetella trematum TaxID=123899 RepID=UPI00068C9FB1|nr:cellulose biosynthesis protein BcsP [Bordetella trematum]
MQGDSDISRLYREFGGDPGEYREITEQEKAEAARHRWPMFDRALPGDAGLMPPSVDEGRTEMPVPAAPWPPGGTSAAPAALPPVSGGHGAPLRRGAALGAGSTHRWWTDAQEAQPGEAPQIAPGTVSVARESAPAAAPVVEIAAPEAPVALEPAVVATPAAAPVAEIAVPEAPVSVEPAVVATPAAAPVAEIAAPEAPVSVEPAVVATPAAAPVVEIAAPEAPVSVEPAVVATPAAAPVAEIAVPEAPVALEPAVVATPAPVAEAAVSATAAPVPEAAAPAVAAVPPAQSAKPSAVAGGASLKGVFARLAQAHRSDAQPPSGSGA